ncbi:MAG: imidazolonepropionase [Rikenellaceae bacterium]
MTLLISNIGCLVGLDTEGVESLRGAEMSQIETLNNAWLLVEDDRFAGWGSMDEPCEVEATKVVDAKGGYLFPSFCDSHTHLVYAGSREGEYVDKINGLSYEQIAQRGGGILNSADLLHATTEEELYTQAMGRIDEIIAQGTGLVEIKSGYGLTTEDELKMLRVVRRIGETSPLAVRSTFLGAHAVGRAYANRQVEYVDLIINEMIPAVAADSLADFVDVFCDKGFFTLSETERIVEAAAKHGMRPKIHANELANSGGVQLGVAHNALSVDHLERIEEPEIEALSTAETVATLLPGAAIFLGIPYPPARRLIEAGAKVALASDFNPGSSPMGSMRMIASLATMTLRMTPTEAINATTINGAAAMGESNNYGSIGVGKVANFFITKPIPSLDYFTYAYTSPLIEKVFLNGTMIAGSCNK